MTGKDDVEIMQTLNALMAEYVQESNDLKNDCQNVDAEIAHWTEIRNLLAKPHQDKLAELESKMYQPMLDRAATFVCAYGKISYRKGAVRRTYNAESLDMLCNAESEVKKLIWPFRSETVGEPSISIKLEV